MVFHGAHPSRGNKTTIAYQSKRGSSYISYQAAFAVARAAGLDDPNPTDSDPVDPPVKKNGPMIIGVTLEPFFPVTKKLNKSRWNGMLLLRAMLLLAKRYLNKMPP